MQHARSLLVAPLAIAALFASLPASAVKVTDHLDLGGAVRARVDSDPDRDIEKISLDTVMLSAAYDSDTWTGAARYRWYGGSHPFQYTGFGGVQFPEYAWAGYRFDAERQVQVGLNKVPFGLQPNFVSAFYESLGNVIGLEDISQVGAKYMQHSGAWDVQAGFYVKPAWQGRGTSNGDTYSIVVTPADGYVAGGSRNEERHAFAARVARSYEYSGWTGETGVSLYSSTLRNLDTREDGHRNAIALHAQGQHGPWGAKVQWARQDMSPRNPQDDHTVTFGGFDGTFNVASRGDLYTADLSYSFPTRGKRLDNFKPYVSYSLFDKSDSMWPNSERVMVGTSFDLKPLWIAAEMQFGRNDPYIGGSSYTQSLAGGGIDHWKSQFYMNVGYYF